MDRSERKAAVSAYKERKAVAGVYAIRCAKTGEQWVGDPLHHFFAIMAGNECCHRFIGACRSGWTEPFSGDSQFRSD